jgi:ribosomal-protein-alanine N-acetyltransferase
MVAQKLFDFSSFPHLETERLQLREILPSDRDALYAIFGDLQTNLYLDGDTLKNPDEALEIIDWAAQIFHTQQGLRWGITLRNGANTVPGHSPKSAKTEGFQMATGRTWPDTRTRC